MRTISPTSSLFGAQRSSTYQWHIYHWATLAMAPLWTGKNFACGQNATL